MAAFRVFVLLLLSAGMLSAQSRAEDIPGIRGLDAPRLWTGHDEAIIEMEDTSCSKQYVRKLVWDPYASYVWCWDPYRGNVKCYQGALVYKDVPQTICEKIWKPVKIRVRYQVFGPVNPSGGITPMPMPEVGQGAAEQPVRELEPAALTAARRVPAQFVSSPSAANANRLELTPVPRVTRLSADGWTSAGPASSDDAR